MPSVNRPAPRCSAPDYAGEDAVGHRSQLRKLGAAHDHRILALTALLGHAADLDEAAQGVAERDRRSSPPACAPRRAAGRCGSACAAARGSPCGAVRRRRSVSSTCAVTQYASRKLSRMPITLATNGWSTLSAVAVSDAARPRSRGSSSSRAELGRQVLALRQRELPAEEIEPPADLVLERRAAQAAQRAPRAAAPAAGRSGSCCSCRSRAPCRFSGGTWMTPVLAGQALDQAAALEEGEVLAEVPSRCARATRSGARSLLAQERRSACARGHELAASRQAAMRQAQAAPWPTPTSLRRPRPR